MLDVPVIVRTRQWPPSRDGTISICWQVLVVGQMKMKSENRNFDFSHGKLTFHSERWRLSMIVSGGNIWTDCSWDY